MQVNILEAKNRLSQLVKSAQSGEAVVIANRGQPVAMLVGTQPGVAGLPERDAGGAGGGDAVIGWLDRHPLPSHARRSAGEIEAALAVERAAWD